VLTEISPTQGKCLEKSFADIIGVLLPGCFVLYVIEEMDFTAGSCKKLLEVAYSITKD